MEIAALPVDDGVFSGPAVRQAHCFYDGPYWQRTGMDEDVEVTSWPEFGREEAK